MTIDELLPRFDNARETGQDKWEARCPVHGDNHNSLCIGIGDDGRLLVHCQAGCAIDDVLSAVSLARRDLFPSVNGNGRHENHSNGMNYEIIATYDYRDENGKLEFQVTRRKPKDFRQRRPNPDGEGWIKNVQCCRVLPFRLPELLPTAVATPVFTPEGEKDVVLSLDRIGLVATCNAGGALKWKAEHAKFLTGRNVVILPDNDDPGRQHGQQVARSLVGIAKSIKIVELPGLQPKGDVSDWIQAGGTKEQLLELVAAAPEWKPNSSAEDLPQSNGSTSDIRPILIGQLIDENPRLNEPMVDGLIRVGETANIISVSKVGKSWLAIMLALCVALGRKFLDTFECKPMRVLYLDNELHPPTIAHRFKKVAEEMGIFPDQYRRFDQHFVAWEYQGLGEQACRCRKKFRAFASVFSNSFFNVAEFKEEFEQIEKLGRISERLNIPTERLAGLRAAATATGVSFEELTGAMQKMLVAVSGSGDPLKKAAADTAFNKLGIAAASLKQLAPEQQFAAIADALSKVANVADRVNIAKSLFGKGGVPILNVLKDGSKGLQDWQRFAEKSGVALNAMDVTKVERAYRSIRAMFVSFQGLTDQIVVRLSPAIEHLGKLFTYLSQTVLPFLQKHAEFLVALIKIAIAYKAAVWAVVAAERALAVATAIKIAITSESWAALARLAAGAVVAGAAVAGIYIAFKKVEEGIDKIKLDIPDIPDLPKDLEDGNERVDIAEASGRLAQRQRGSLLGRGQCRRRPDGRTRQTTQEGQHDPEGHRAEHREVSTDRAC